MADSPLASKVMISPSNSGRGFAKTFGVVHDIECPPGPSWAESLGGPNYMQNRANGVSVQYIVDSDTVVQTGYEDTWCWGAGKYANKRSIQIEQAGYASFSRAQWLGLAEAIGTTYRRPDGSTRTFTAADAAAMSAQFDLLARLIADISKRHGWKAERGTADELRRASNGEGIGKWWRHVDVSDILGGTVHRDTGEGLPFDDLLTRARAYMAPTRPSAPVVSTTTTTTEEPEMVIAHVISSAGNHSYGQLLFDGIHFIRDNDVRLLMNKAGAKQINVSIAEWNAARAADTGAIK